MIDEECLVHNQRVVGLKMCVSRFRFVVVCRWFAFLLITVSCFGCATVAGWASQLENNAYCGMPLTEIANVSGREPREESMNDFNYLVRSGGTDVWLKTENGRLIALQLFWTEQFMRYAGFPRTHLCEDIPAPPGSLALPKGYFSSK